MEFHKNYSNLVEQLPPSIIQESWKRLTRRKNNPLTEVEVGNINSEIENFLKHEVEKYKKKKERQRRSIKYSSEQAPPKLSNSVTLIDKQDAQKSESSLLCTGNNVASSADIKIFNQKLTNRLKQENLIYLEAERQKLTNEKDTEISNVKNEYDKLIDENNKNIYILKQKLEDQYESRVSAMETQNTKNYNKTLEEKDKKIAKLSSDNKRYKNYIVALKESNKSSLEKINKLGNKCQQLEDIIDAKDQKIINLNDHIISFNPHGGRDGTIEPESYFSYAEKGLWANRYYNSETNLENQKKFTFRKNLHG
ncbi:670_t:CDS:1 [Entrophospora sp. SA101]|nr:670_t:CDS:1 [Entrophospora sp. SA101]